MWELMCVAVRSTSYVCSKVCHMFLYRLSVNALIRTFGLQLCTFIGYILPFEFCVFAM